MTNPELARMCHSWGQRFISLRQRNTESSDDEDRHLAACDRVLRAVHQGTLRTTHRNAIVIELFDERRKRRHPGIRNIREHPGR